MLRFCAGCANIPGEVQQQATFDIALTVGEMMNDRRGVGRLRTAAQYDLGGRAEVDAAAGFPNIPETQDYIQRILSTLRLKQ